MRAIFLDRDGVICLNRPDHVKSWSEFVFLACVQESLARLAALDMPIIVITNQAAINRGIVSAEEVEGIHHRMVAEVEATGGRIDRVYCCPHRPDEKCGCRKPQPGLLEQAAGDLGIELQGSYVVGDAYADIQAGLRVGCTAFLVLTGRGLRQVVHALREAPGRFQVVRDLQEAVTSILWAEGYASYQTEWRRGAGNPIELASGLHLCSATDVSPPGHALLHQSGQEPG
jgi:D-glycero-D-manno-heptose 1,7-bisphosphate phosphatase